jgi:hypothetical protein
MPQPKMDTPPSQPPKLLDQVRNTLRQRNYAYATEKTYLDWIERFIHFSKEKLGYFRHPKEMGAPEIEAYLTHLAVEKNVAPPKTRPSMPSSFSTKPSLSKNSAPSTPSALKNPNASRLSSIKKKPKKLSA